MPKYYMYDVATGDPKIKALAAILDPETFATHVFDPRTMKFTGITVDAKNEAAARAFDGLLYSDEEPEPTARKRAIHDSVNHVEDMIARTIIKLICKNLYDLNRYICMVASSLHKQNPDISAECYYIKLRDNIINDFLKVHKYNG